MTNLVWLRHDLRVADNPALYHAAEQGKVAAVFVLCRQQWAEHDVGPARLAFLYRCLQAVGNQLAALGVPLTVLDADTFAAVPQCLLAHADKVGAQKLFFNAEYGWNERLRDKAVVDACLQADIDVQRDHGGVVMVPGEILSQQQQPFKVFSAFKKVWLSQLSPARYEPLPPPATQGKALKAWQLPGELGTATELHAQLWPGGEDEARRRLAEFADTRISAYEKHRDLPALPGTSTLSPYLSTGAVSAAQCLQAAYAVRRKAANREGADSWINELIWRDFYRHVMHLFPHVGRGRAFKADTQHLPWRQAPEELLAWQQGRTGYPLVDAAMRQLLATGWMHNRLRMVAAMFLTKHLLIDWRAGEAYFMQQLVDGDFASNNGGWQWSASTGTDAAPYFRIFNPATQGQRFDPKGEFVRTYVPELADVPDKHLYNPLAYDANLDYPQPVVEHKFARQRALDFFKGR